MEKYNLKYIRWSCLGMYTDILNGYTVNGIAKIARKLGINYAEATIDFEFVKRRSVPVSLGIVVAKENEQMLLEVNNNRDERRIRSSERNFHGFFSCLFFVYLMIFYL